MVFLDVKALTQCVKRVILKRGINRALVTERRASDISSLM